MRILFAAISESFYAAHRINQLANQNRNIHLFPFMDNGVYPASKNTTEHLSVYGKTIGANISDSIGMSLLERLGVFPIQFGTFCANEWVEDGVSATKKPNYKCSGIAPRIGSSGAKHSAMFALNALTIMSCKPGLSVFL